MKKAVFILILSVCLNAAGCAFVATPGGTPPPAPAAPGPSTEAPGESTPQLADERGPFFFQAPETAPLLSEIRIYKGKRTMELVLDGEIAGRFPIGLGFAPEGDKEKEGDGRTPVGEYYVCSRNDRSNFYLSLGVSYPNTEDAQRGLEAGLIDRETYERIADAEQRRQRPDWNTALGGEICIHGGGSSRDWTWGCIATDDENMDILWEYCPLGTPIYIYE